jgi:hypothetical protein
MNKRPSEVEGIFTSFELVGNGDRFTMEDIQSCLVLHAFVWAIGITVFQFGIDLSLWHWRAV